jgi:CRP-like cAMP-binding protein
MIMKHRFEGNGRHLVDSLRRQEIVAGNTELANALIKDGQLVEFAKGDKIIAEGGEDDDIYFLLAGSAAIVVKGNEVATRKAGQHVGEMAAVEPAQKRAATVVSHDALVALKLSSPKLHEIGAAFPQVWLTIARELSRRLYQRNDLIPPPNEHPKLFIISSSIGMTIAICCGGSASRSTNQSRAGAS